MKRIVAVILFSFFVNLLFAQNEKPTTIKIGKELSLVKISDHAYVHISYMKNKLGNIPCNGMLLVNNGEAFLFDTPSADSVTEVLLLYIKNMLKLKMVGFISNDWHEDSMGGLDAVNKAGIPSYANEMTREIAKGKALPVHSSGFKDSLSLKLGDMDILCYYMGAAHTMDNIVVWIPSEKILFADCMVKELKAKDLGYTEDGDVAAYPATLKKVKDKFRDAAIVIPGHGDYGGVELINHTIKLTQVK